MSRNHANGTRAEAYRSHLASVTTDMQGAVQCYGRQFCHWLVNTIADHRLNTAACIRSWEEYQKHSLERFPFHAWLKDPYTLRILNHPDAFDHIESVVGTSPKPDNRDADNAMPLPRAEAKIVQRQLDADAANAKLVLARDHMNEAASIADKLAAANARLEATMANLIALKRKPRRRVAKKARKPGKRKAR